MRAAVRTRSDGRDRYFRGVAGNIGLRHDLCELAVMFIYHCDPGAGADPMQASFPHKVILINGVDKPRHDKARAVTITIRQQQAKLIATQTGGDRRSEAY